MTAFLCLAGGGVRGGESNETAHAATPSSSRMSWLANGEFWDERHSRASERIVRTVDRLDRLFGDESLSEVNRRTRMTLGLGLEHNGRDGLSLLSDLRLRLSFPRLEERLQLVLDDAFEVDHPDDQRAIVEAVKDRKPDAGLRYFLARRENMKFSTDLGVRLRDPVQWFARARWDYRRTLRRWDFRMTETVFWFTIDGWRETTDVNFSRPLPSDWLFRSSSRLTWEEIRSGVTPAQTLSMTWQPGTRRAWRFFLSGVWPETPHTREANYTAGIVFRRQLHRDWLFMEISPSIEFPQAFDYELNTIAAINFEIIFSAE